MTTRAPRHDGSIVDEQFWDRELHGAGADRQQRVGGPNVISICRPARIRRRSATTAPAATRSPG